MPDRRQHFGGFVPTRVALVIPGVVDVKAVQRDGLGTAGDVTVLEGVRPWLASFSLNLANCLQTGLILFFAIFGLRQLLRRDRLAALTGAVLFAFLQGFRPSEPNWIPTFGLYLLIFGLLMFALVRLGIVTAMAAIFFLNLGSSVIIGLEWRTWYAPTGLVTLAILLGLTLMAFNYSLGSRELLGGDV